MSKKSGKSNGLSIQQKEIHKRVKELKQRQAVRISQDSGRGSSQTLSGKEAFNRS